jgi:hypothetical protein
MDICCPKCGQPWDSYGITYAKGEGDLTLTEVKRFLQVRVVQLVIFCFPGIVCYNIDSSLISLSLTLV